MAQTGLHIKSDQPSSSRAHFSATTSGATLHFQLAGMGPFSGRPVTAQTKRQTKQQTNTEVVGLPVLV